MPHSQLIWLLLSRSARRSDLGRIAAACRELIAGPPTSFHAALQLVQFTRVLGGRGCIGRLDQWLFPFYPQDLAQGTSDA